MCALLLQGWATTGEPWAQLLPEPPHPEPSCGGTRDRAQQLLPPGRRAELPAASFVYIRLQAGGGSVAAAALAGLSPPEICLQ